MILNFKKIHDKLMNSLVFLVSLCFLLGFICAAVLLIQIPDYIDMIMQRQIDQKRMELTTTLDTLEENYYDNSRKFYASYLESPFHNWKNWGSVQIVDYTDEDIRIYTMDNYFENYLRPMLVDESRAEFSTEVSMFIQLYGDLLSENEELVQIINDRETLQSTIKDVMEQLKGIPDTP